MNRLKGSCVYLAGPRDEVPDLGSDWREWITPKLQALGMGVYNPCDKPTDDGTEVGEDRELMTRLRDKETWDSYSKLIKEIVRADLDMVDSSNSLILNVDKDYHACGSYNEQTVACIQRKPVIVHCRQGKSEIPGWLFGILDHNMFFGTWDEVLEYYEHVNSTPNVGNVVGTWTFYNYDKVFGRTQDDTE